MYGQNMKVLIKESLEGTGAACADNKNIILALLNRDDLVEFLPQKGLPVLDPARVAKLKEQFDVATALYEEYVKPLFAARDIRVRAVPRHALLVRPDRYEAVVEGGGEESLGSSPSMACQ